MTDKKKKLIADAVFLLFWLGATAFLVWKAHYGFADRDESFYLTIPKRILQGDAILVEEWHVSQLSGILLVPIMAIYLLINPTAVGMMLHFRLIYVGLQAIVSLILYSRLKRYSTVGALMGALIFMIYAPFGISALSYNSMGVELFALSTVLFVTRETGWGKYRGLFYDAIVGALFSAAVLCQPYLAALYFVYAICALVWSIVLKRSKISALSLSRLLGITIGVALSVMAFAWLLFSRTDLHTLMKAIPLILSDPEHPARTLWSTVESFVWCIKTSSPIAPLCYLSIGILMLAAALDRRSKTRKTIYFTLAAAISVVYAVKLRDWSFINCMMMPLNLVGAVSFFLLKKRPYPLFFGVWLPTVFFAWAISATSNQGFLVISSAFSVGTLISALFVFMFVGEYEIPEPHSILSTVAATMTCLVVFAFGIELRATQNFWDGRTGDLDHVIEEGVNRGVITSEYNKIRWERLLEDTAPLRSIEDGNVLYFSTETAMYLSDNKRSSAFSSWISIGDKEEHQIKAALDRLCDYYELCPDKFPDYIYVDIKTNGTLDAIVSTFDLSDYKIETTKYGNTVIKTNKR